MLRELCCQAPQLMAAPPISPQAKSHEKMLTGSIKPVILLKICSMTLMHGPYTAMFKTIRVSNFFYFYFWAYDPGGKRCA